MGTLIWWLLVVSALTHANAPILSTLWWMFFIANYYLDVQERKMQ